MTKDRKTKADKILHRKLNNEQHELHYKMWDELRCSKMAGSSYLRYTGIFKLFLFDIVR
jgi:hypothetical protein